MRARFCNAEEVSEVLGVHITTVYRWAKSGWLRADPRTHTLHFTERAVAECKKKGKPPRGRPRKTV